jgi:histidinol-phosphate aminotransferase
MIKSLPYVSSINPYVPGKPMKELERELGITGSVKLASNENPIGASAKAIEALRHYLIGEYDLHRYPEGSGYYLKDALAKKLGHNISQDELILGNGSNELLDIAVRTFMSPGDEAVMARPSFVVYSMAVQAVGARAIEIPLTLDYRHDLQAMAGAVNEKTKIVFIANPNNPTGTINSKDEFESFMKRIPDNVLVVVDEAYFEYVVDADYPDTLQYFMKHSNLLILRTFSKAYGLAGLRIGYGIGRKELVVEMNKIRAPFNTSTLSQLAALHALSDDEHLEKSIAVNEAGKEYLYKELDALNLQYVPTQANFIYMPIKRNAKEIYESLLKKGVIIRPMGAQEIRVTIGLPEENRRFIETLKTVMRDG